MTKLQKILYTARTHAVGARDELGLEQQVAQELVEGADKICPYSQATRGNIEIVIPAIASHVTPQAKMATGS